MPKLKAKPAKMLRGGLDRGRAVRQPRQLSEVEQRTITHKAAIDSACSGQWVQQIIHERLDAYPPPGMKLGDAKVLTPAWNAPAEEQSNSGGVNGTRRWTPRGAFSGCRWGSNGSPIIGPSMEDEHDLIEVGKVRHATRWWPEAIKYGQSKATKGGEYFHDPRPPRHAASPIRVTRFTRLLDWPAHAVPEEPVVISGVE